MKLEIHGIRGSVPNPSPEVLQYGGNTSCYEIETGKFQIFLDAGTGFRNARLERSTKHQLILLSHFHHDHIQGIPFNYQLFAPGKKIYFSSGLCKKNDLKEILGNYFSGRYFPVDIFNELSHLEVMDIEEAAEFLERDVLMEQISLNHPGGSVGYSLKCSGKKIVSLLDNEYKPSQKSKLIEFCRNTDILIWDGMFTDEELKSKQGWGHSSIEQAEKFAREANIKKTMICHYAPDRTDMQIEDLKKQFTSSLIQFGYENLMIDL